MGQLNSFDPLLFDGFLLGDLTCLKFKNVKTIEQD